MTLPANTAQVVHGTVPIGGGRSWSASLEVACALAFQAVGGIAMPPRDIAEICQQAENRCVGAMCGILDRCSSLLAKEGAELLLDCRSLTHVEVGSLSDLRIVICDTNWPRTLAGSLYARRCKAFDEGTSLLNLRDPVIRTLRDVNTPLFEHLKDALLETIHRR